MSKPWPGCGPSCWPSWLPSPSLEPVSSSLFASTFCCTWHRWMMEERAALSMESEETLSLLLLRASAKALQVFVCLKLPALCASCRKAVTPRGNQHRTPSLVSWSVLWPSKATPVTAVLVELQRPWTPMAEDSSSGPPWLWKRCCVVPMLPSQTCCLGHQPWGNAVGKGRVMRTGEKMAPNWYLSQSAAKFQLWVLTPAVSSDYLSLL